MSSLPDGCTLIALESVGSTNDEARARALDGASDGTVVWAREQIAGRGRRGRTWSSPQGNLYTSTIFRPGKPAGETAQLSLVAAVALGDALASLLPEAAAVGCKWPNDILVNGAKVAGILLESSGSGGAVPWVVVGCGINVASHPDDANYTATDLDTVLERAIGLETVLEAFLASLFRWRDRWLKDGVAPIRQAWIDRAVGIGGPITVRLPDRELVGRFSDMDADGALLLELPDGVCQRITAGDVFL
ncbi:MAG: biotin--[acetyl-CoA-carboxylase] ligase [Alphaproteobacteria bacterium]|nr:biotin--[acetyl-CoA-carboxylase] ligase [Alphaproteobacteria bacterium]